MNTHLYIYIWSMLCKTSYNTFDPGCRLSSPTWHLSVSAHLIARCRSCVTYASLTLKHSSNPVPLWGAVPCCDLSSRSLWLELELVPFLAAALWEVWLSQSLWLKLEMVPVLAAALWRVWFSQNLWLKLEMVLFVAATLWRVWLSQSQWLDLE